MKKLLLTALFLFTATVSNAQNDFEKITATIQDYMDGTSQGQPEKIKKAFHEDLNLYSIDEDQNLKVWAGKEYVSGFMEGRKNDRIGRIISIDYENDAAIAKAEILVPGEKLFIDYFLLLKINEQWKIIHKAYTSRNLPLK